MSLESSTFLLITTQAFVAIVVLFIFWFVARDAVPFFRLRGFQEFFTSSEWYPADVRKPQLPDMIPQGDTLTC